MCAKKGIIHGKSKAVQSDIHFTNNLLQLQSITCIYLDILNFTCNVSIKKKHEMAIKHAVNCSNVFHLQQGITHYIFFIVTSAQVLACTNNLTVTFEIHNYY